MKFEKEILKIYFWLDSDFAQISANLFLKKLYSNWKAFII